MELDAFRWLLTPPGQALLARAEQLTGPGGEAPLRVQTVLRRGAEPAQVAVALTQAELRRRAVPKFGERAGVLYFTPDGLEQATRQRVAEHRAARLVAFEARSLVDLGCGIGGDLIAAASAGLVCAGVDLDPVRVEVARANLAALGLDGAVQVADAADVDPSPFDVAFVDPARRSGRGRSFDPADWTPSWSLVESLLRRDACAKVAPGIPHDLVPDGVEAEWVSDCGEVKEAALWSGGLATCARRATVIGDRGLVSITEDDDPGAPVRPLGRYLLEPDGAVVRAGLVTAVAARLPGGGLLDEHIAYVTADGPAREVPGDPALAALARGYEVLETLPYREKALRAALRERGIGRLTIKKRGVDVVPEQLRRRLDLRGDAEATVVLTRVAGEGTALLVRPL